MTCNYAFSAAWKTSGITIPKNILKPLIEKFPDIKSDEDLAELLNQIVQLYPSAKVSPVFNGVMWNINVEKNLVIVAITAQAISKSLEVNIEKVSAKFRGTIFNPESLEKIEKVALESLKKSGYPNALILITTAINKHRVSLTIKIKAGPKCTISRVNFQLTLPNNITTPKIKGEICSISKLTSIIEKIEKNLKSMGYAFARLNFDSITYSKDKTKGILNINGKVGKIINYQFISEDRDLNKSILWELKDKLNPVDYLPFSVRSEIIKMLRSDGYHSSVVNGPVVSSHQDKTVETYSFKISTGPITKLSEVSLVGVNIFSKSKVISIIQRKNVLNSTNKIDMKNLEEGLNNLKSAYQKIGYWDVRIREPRLVTDSVTGNTLIVLHVEEGLQRKLQNIQIRGNKFISDEKIKNLLNLKVGMPINKRSLATTERSIYKAYTDGGFIYSKIKIKIKSKRVRNALPSTISIEVSEGKQASFGQVFLFGLSKTREKVVLRELTFKQGEKYSPKKIEESKQKLIGTGIFKSVLIEPMDKFAIEEQGRVIDISVTMKENDARIITFGPGYDVFKGYNYVIEASHKNISGMARKFSVRTFLSEDKQQEAVRNSTLLGTILGLGFTEPYILNLPFDGNFTISYKAKATNFWNFSTISQQRFSHKLNSANIGSISLYSRQKLNKEIGSEEQIALFLTPGNTTQTSIGIKYEVDSRNDISWPTTGYFLGFEIENANYKLGGDVKFTKTDFLSNAFYGIGKSIVLAFSLNYTKYFNINRNDSEAGYNTLPTSEALFAGGSGMIRGFQKQLGPYIRYFIKDDFNRESIKQEQFVGGTTRVVNKLEIRYLMSRNSALTYFYDIGNSFIDQTEITKMNIRLSSQSKTREKVTIEDNFIFPLESIVTNSSKFLNSVYSSTGISINFITPFGRFRFGYGIPVTQPTSSICQANSEYCSDRGSDNAGFFKRGKIDLGIDRDF